MKILYEHKTIQLKHTSRFHFYFIRFDLKSLKGKWTWIESEKRVLTSKWSKRDETKENGRKKIIECENKASIFGPGAIEYTGYRKMEKISKENEKFYLWMRYGMRHQSCYNHLIKKYIRKYLCKSVLNKFFGESKANRECEPKNSKISFFRSFFWQNNRKTPYIWNHLRNSNVFTDVKKEERMWERKEIKSIRIIKMVIIVYFYGTF